MRKECVGVGGGGESGGRVFQGEGTSHAKVLRQRRTGCSKVP